MIFQHKNESYLFIQEVYKKTKNSTFIRGIQKLDREIFHDLLHKNENYLFIQEVYKKNKFFKEIQGLILDSIFILIKLIRV